MNVSFIIQCIDTFGFVPAEDGLRFFANEKRFCPIRKSGGFYIISKELPNEFTLLIRSDIYYDFEYRANLDMKVIRINLIRKSAPPRRVAVQFNAKEHNKAVLEYGYFYLGKSVWRGDERISVENPYRFCLEGRSFLLVDTSSGTEEFIVLQAAGNALMTDYHTGKITYDYSAEHSAILPAFDLYVNATIPVEAPPSGSAAIRIYEGNGKKIVRIRTDASIL